MNILILRIEENIHFEDNLDTKKIIDYPKIFDREIINKFFLKLINYY